MEKSILRDEQVVEIVADALAVILHQRPIRMARERTSFFLQVPDPVLDCQSVHVREPRSLS